jgi:hypothetical protein
MSKFDTKLVEQIKAREVVEQLVIDGIGCLDAYQIELEKQYQSELRNILKYVEYASNGNGLPDTKLKKYGNTDGVTEYEFKSDHLRVWAIQQPNKKVIILGGYKNSQPADEKTFRSLKKQFLEFLKHKK